MKILYFEGTLIDGDSETPSSDALAPEAPLHITVNTTPYITTMRTPDGYDEELAIGLLYTEGILQRKHPPIRFNTVRDPESQFAARLNLTIAPDGLMKEIEDRTGQLAGSSCGVCGAREPADLELFGDPLVVSETVAVVPAAISAMMAEMRSRQSIFQQTGGTHGASAFTRNGGHLVTHEDIGRHNAVDKVIGALIERGRLSDVSVLTVSSRISYEIVTKAYRAGIPILAAVSAPSSMAVETSEAFGITLVGFCRDDRMTVYTNPSRITRGAPQP